MPDGQAASPSVLFEQRGPVAVVTLNRPASMNAVNADLSELLGAAVDRIDRDPEIRAAIITGTGRAFCAGADLKAAAAGVSNFSSRRDWGFAGFTQHVISKPLIAAVNGAARGGGLEIVLACDLAVASSAATFGLPEVTRGLIAGAGGLVRLAEQIPRKLALELALTGEPMTAARAAQLGLVNAVVEPDSLMAAAVALADRIAVNAPLAVQASKRVLQRIVAGARPEEALGWALNQAEGAALSGSQDSREGPVAFAQKRPPVWTGR